MTRKKDFKIQFKIAKTEQIWTPLVLCILKKTGGPIDRGCSQDQAEKRNVRSSTKSHQLSDHNQNSVKGGLESCRKFYAKFRKIFQQSEILIYFLQQKKVHFGQKSA